MEKSCPDAARLAATFQLRKLWAKSPPPKGTPIPEFLATAPERVAKELLGFEIVTPHLILGEEGVAGFIDRANRVIGVACRAPLVAQRFTLAHEIGHCVLHAGQSYLRDRSLTAPGASKNRPYYEIEADHFAAELLMPRKLVKAAFLRRFGASLDLSEPDRELTLSLFPADRKRQDPFEYMALDRLGQARAIANSCSYKGVSFISLCELFRVSSAAMARQLLDCGCIL